MDLQSKYLTPDSSKIFPLLGSFWNEDFVDRDLALTMSRMPTDFSKTYHNFEHGLNNLMAVGKRGFEAPPFTHKITSCELRLGHEDKSTWLGMPE